MIALFNTQRLTSVQHDHLLEAMERNRMIVPRVNILYRPPNPKTCNDDLDEVEETISNYGLVAVEAIHDDWISIIGARSVWTVVFVYPTNNTICPYVGEKTHSLSSSALVSMLTASGVLVQWVLTYTTWNEQ